MRSRDLRRSTAVGRAWACCVSLAAMILCCLHVHAQAPESSVKAAYIYRFLEYVAWPAESLKAPDDPLTIGVIQDDDVAAELVRITRDHVIQNRRLAVVRVRQEKDLAVHVLYVPTPDSAKALMGVARQRPILIVTDAYDGLDNGAIINFVPSEGRIKFEVSLDAAQRAGLTISARLLAIALRVKKSDYSSRMHARLDERISAVCHWLSVRIVVSSPARAA